MGHPYTDKGHPCMDLAIVRRNPTQWVECACRRCGITMYQTYKRYHGKNPFKNCPDCTATRKSYELAGKFYQQRTRGKKNDRR